MLVGIIIGLVIMSIFATIGLTLYENGKDEIGILFFGPIVWAILLLSLLLKIVRFPKIRHFPTNTILQCMEVEDEIIHLKGKWFYNKKVNTFYKGDKKYKKIK